MRWEEAALGLPSISLIEAPPGDTPRKWVAACSRTYPSCGVLLPIPRSLTISPHPARAETACLTWLGAE
jgi:hypothetical protein